MRIAFWKTNVCVIRDMITNRLFAAYVLAKCLIKML